MYYAIFILPNSGDAWETASPFSTLLGSGHLGFCFSNQIASSLTEYTLISSKLLDISEIDRSVDIFGGASSEIKGGISLNGVGGVATSGDFSFTLEKTGIDPLKLLGRTVKVTIDLTNANIQNLGTHGAENVFTGKIRKVNPGRQSIELICSGLLAILREKEVGTLSNFDSDVYKSKIVPIVYGDFTDENAMVEVILDNNVKNNPAIIIDSQPMTSIENVCIYDVDTKTKINYNNGNIDNLKITDNKKIDIVVDNGLTLFSAVNSTSTEINVYSPPLIVMEFTIIPTYLQENITTYQDGAGRCFVYKSNEAGYLKFTCSGTAPGVNILLTKITGDGPATLTTVWVSDIIDPILNIEKSGRLLGTPNLIQSGRPVEATIRIDNEILLLYYYRIVNDANGIYWYSTYTVSRGYKDSIPDSHEYLAPIYSSTNEVQSTWRFFHTVWCSAVSNFNFINESTEVEEDFVPSNDLNDLSSMHRTNTQGDWVTFTHLSTGTSASSLFIDLAFPKLGLKGNIVNAYLLGAYKIDGGVGDLITSSLGVYEDSAEINSVYLLYKDGIADILVELMSGGMGRLISAPLISDGYNPTFVFPYFSRYFNQNLINRTISVLAFVKSSIDPFIYTELGRDFYFCNVRPVSEPASIINLTEKSYSLTNKVEVGPGNIYYRDFTLGDINGFLSKNIVLRWFHQYTEKAGLDNTAVLSIANPGLLLEMEINPLESKIYVQGTGRGALDTPQDILTDILDKELSFTNVTDMTVDRVNWKQSVNLANDIVSFGDLAQSICEQGGLILSELTDGYLAIHDLTPPTDTSVLSVIHDEDVLLEGNMAAIEEEWTTIDGLVTDLTVSYAYNAAGEYYSATNSTAGTSARLAEAQAIIDEDRKATIELPYVRDANTVARLGALVSIYNTSPMRILTMQLTPAMHVLSIGQWVTCNIDGLNKEKAYLIIGYTLDLRGRVTVRLLETAGNPVESIQDSYTAYSDDNDWIDTMTVYGDDNDILDSHS